MNLADTIIKGVKAGDVDAIDIATALIGRLKVVECSEAEIDAIAAYVRKPPAKHITKAIEVGVIVGYANTLLKEHHGSGPRYSDALVDLCLQAAGWDGSQWDDMAKMIGVKS